MGCNVSLNRLVTLGYDTGQLGTRLVSHLDAVLLVDLHARGCGLDFSSERKVGFTENTAIKFLRDKMMMFMTITHRD